MDEEKSIRICFVKSKSFQRLMFHENKFSLQIIYNSSGYIKHAKGIFFACSLFLTKNVMAL